MAIFIWSRYHIWVFLNLQSILKNGDGNGGGGEYCGVYRLIPEHGCTVHCSSAYLGIVYGGGEESGNAFIQEMVVAPCPWYPEYFGRKFSRGEDGEDGDIRLGGER